jgi:uncharacterized protein
MGSLRPGGPGLAATLGDPDHSEEESRLITVGYSARGRLLVVSHIERGATRVISARCATLRERKRHEGEEAGAAG